MVGQLGRLCVLLWLASSQTVAFGPYQNKCEWSEWRCRDLPDGTGCYAQRGRFCCGRAAVIDCPSDNYEQQLLSSREQQLAIGVVCHRHGGGGGGLSGDAEACQAAPTFDGSKFPPPGWCPWTAWSAWALECREGLDRLPELAGLVAAALGNESEGFKHSARTRGCYCPASPDGNYTCPGPRRQFRAIGLRHASGSGGGGGSGDFCQWCSWGAWQPACSCPLPAGFPQPRRARRCLCSGGNDSTADACGAPQAALEVAPSVEAVCAICSHLHASYRVAQFLNPLAIGFAVYLTVALAAFLVCKLFCGDPRQSDANSRDQLSVDDFLTTAQPATSTV